MKRRFLAVLLAVLLLAATLVPAYAAASYDADWIPPVPDWIISIENGFQFSLASLPSYYRPGEKRFQEVSDWFEDLYDDDALLLILLDQGVYNRYNEENNIDYDRQFSIYIVAPDKKSSGAYYDLGGFEHMGGPQHQQQMNTPGPMSYLCLNNPHSFAKVIYDQKTESLVLSPSLSHLPGGSGSKLRFTYVLAAGNYKTLYTGGMAVHNGPFSETSEIYPGFTRVSGKDFGVGTIYQQFVDGKAVEHWRDYDWWLGIEGDPIPPYNSNLDKDQDVDGDGNPDLNVDIDGDGKPDINIDTDGDGKPDLNVDTNGDKKPDLNIDLDGDGKPDINIDTNGDGKPDLNIDTDGDGKPDTNVDIDGDGKPDVNIRPGEGSGDGSSGSSSESGSSSSSSGGGSESGSSGPSTGDGEEGTDPGGDSGGGSSSDKGSGPPDTWFKDEGGNDLDYNVWSFFNPFASLYEPFSWNKNYDPLEGYTPGQMPDFPQAGDPNYGARDPFDIPNDIKFKDFAIQFGG